MLYRIGPRCLTNDFFVELSGQRWVGQIRRRMKCRLTKCRKNFWRPYKIFCESSCGYFFAIFAKNLEREKNWHIFARSC
jgi:hypothetical protein